MQILTLVPSHSLTRVAKAVSTGKELLKLSPATLEAVLRSGDAKVVVIDPEEIRHDDFLRLLTFAKASGNAKVVLYTAIAGAAASRILQAIAVMPVEVVFAGREDDDATLRLALEIGIEPTLPALVLGHLADPLRRMRPDAVAPVVSLFGAATVPPDVGTFLEAFPCSSDAARDWLADAGFGRPSKVRWCAVLSRYLHYTRTHPAASVEAAVRGASAGSSRSVRRACMRFLGASARKVVLEDPTVLAMRLASVAVSN